MRWRSSLEAQNNSARQRVRDRPNLLMAGCMALNSRRAPKLDALKSNGFQEMHYKKCKGSSYIDAMLSSKFVFSPFGAGHNNHRDWEILLAGAIPLLDYDPILAETLWDGLPVVHVRNWSHVTPSFLHKTWADMQKREYSWTKVYQPYWLSMLLAPPGSALEAVPSEAPAGAAASQSAERGARDGAGGIDDFPFVTMLNLVQMNVLSRRPQDLFPAHGVGRGLCNSSMAITEPRLIARCWPRYWDSRRVEPSVYRPSAWHWVPSPPSPPPSPPSLPPSPSPLPPSPPPTILCRLMPSASGCFRPHPTSKTKAKGWIN